MGFRFGTNIDRDREKRFVVTVPAAIAFVGFLVAGVASLIAGAVSITNAKANRVVAEESAKRIVDKANSNINDIIVANGTSRLAKAYDKGRYMAARSARAHNIYYDSQRAISTSTHLLLQTKEWELSNPATEFYAKAIKTMVFTHIRGLTSAEYENTRLATTGMSILVTKLSPIIKGSRTCRNSVLSKTLVVPLVDLPTKTTYQLAGNGHLLNKNGRQGTYIVLSADAMIG